MIDDKVSNAIQAIYDKHGEVVPTMVVQQARNKRSPLHKEFEWDDQKAGEQYRLEQARRLIRRVRIVAEPEQEPERLVHIPQVSRQAGESGEGSYKPPSAIIKSKTEYQLALEQALTRLRSAQRAVEELRTAAEAAEDETLSHILLAYEALSTANEALRSIH